MELTSSSSLIPQAINCCPYGAKGSVKGAFLERLGAQVVGGLSGLNCYRQSFPQKGRDRSVLSSGKEFPLRVSTKASNSYASQDTDDMYDDLFKKYGKVVFKSSDQKSSIAEVDDDAESLSFAVELAKVASEVKAGDIKVLFVKRLVYWTRFFIIATAFSRPQIEAIGSRIRDLAEKQYGRFPTGDYKPNSWTLLDFVFYHHRLESHEMKRCALIYNYKAEALVLLHKNRSLPKSEKLTTSATSPSRPTIINACKLGMKPTRSVDKKHLQDFPANHINLNHLISAPTEFGFRA
ncbi:hypothetical protein QQ045_028153 [Rhodiola kirilowii]